MIGTCWNRAGARVALGALLVALCIALPTATPASPAPLSLATPRAVEIDPEVLAKIREEGTERSQLMRTMHYLTDRFGPRLTGSPNHRAAAEWAVAQMTEWGLENGHLEPFDFGRPGWANERLEAHLVAPVKDALVGEVLAWTPGTDGRVTASAYHLIVPEEPTAAELDAHLGGVAHEVMGKIVLVGPHQLVPVDFDPGGKRRPDEQVRRQYDPDPEARGGGGRRGRGGPQRERAPDALDGREVARRVDEFLVENRALVKIEDAGRAHGQIRAFANRTYDPAQAVPTVILRNEDYGRISRLLAYGDSVVLEFNIVNRIYPAGRTSYNAIAEIPGTDKADEVVMLGGHLDSWHSATGATDNAIGCATMMEAARILKAVGVQPRRTIRVALWGGEEQGLIGSQAYVAEHFGSAEEPKPAYEKFGGYFNIDSGTGRIRGASVFGPPEAAGVLRGILASFGDMGVAGAIATDSRRRGGSDHTSFNEAGLPGIGMGLDPIEYGSHTWHTNLDTYERIVEEDVTGNAVIVAAAVYELATRDELLPRFAADRMPARPEGIPRP